MAMCAPGLAAAVLVVPAQAQVLIAGSRATPESDISPEQEQQLLGEYWKIAKGYKLDPAATVALMSKWTRDRIGKAQSIQYQPDHAARQEYTQSKAEWNPDTLRLAAMLHSDLALAALRARNLLEFEFQHGIADGWFVLADNRQSAAGSLRSRWNVSVARLLLAGGDIGLAERILLRVTDRIPNDPGILLAHGTVKETQAARLIAEVQAGRLDEPAVAVKPRQSALDTAQSLFERALKADPSLLEAKVRLAHVAMMKRDDARAEQLAGEVAALETAPAAMKYVASLILGDVRQRQGKMDPAARAYIDAIRAFPDGQSAYLALAQILTRSGQRENAATMIERLFARNITNPAADPWWTYPLGLDLNMDAEFEEYRTLVRK
jgi:Tfp pilus assembly protein PilF